MSVLAVLILTHRLQQRQQRQQQKLFPIKVQAAIREDKVLGPIIAVTEEKILISTIMTIEATMATFKRHYHVDGPPSKILMTALDGVVAMGILNLFIVFLREKVVVGTCMGDMVLLEVTEVIIHFVW